MRGLVVELVQGLGLAGVRVGVMGNDLVGSVEVVADEVKGLAPVLALALALELVQGQVQTVGWEARAKAAWHASA